MKDYIYNSEIGTFEIRQKDTHRYELWLEDELLGEYENANLAAADVSNFDTDYVEWDKLKNELENVPKGLSDWDAVKEEKPHI